MTPTQLRAFAAVVRLGSVKAAAAELSVTEAAVSLHVAQLRKELGDQLFTRTAAGLAFTPGGLRLASRAAELLGLQDRTVLEVSQAGAGRRLLRVGASSLFAEYAAPGLIELFARRADDLDVELSVHGPQEFPELLRTRSIDVAIGPHPTGTIEAVTGTAFLNYELVVVAAPDDPVAGSTPSVEELRDRTWLLGPSLTADHGLFAAMLRRLGVPESRQRIFQSHAAALDEARRGNGVAIALASAVSRELAHGSLCRVPARHTQAKGVWGALHLARDTDPTAAEFLRFVTTPRAAQAMLRGAGVTAGRFRPSIHVTLWS